MSKPRLATLVLGGCTGCHLALLDTHEALLDILEAADLVHSPLTEGDEIPECDIMLVEGAVANEHDEEIVKRAREQAKVLVAMGACATLGGIGGLRNLQTVGEVFETAYGDEAGPGDESLPRLFRRVRPISALVPVDVEVPGCAPNTETLVEVIGAALNGQLWKAPRRNLCHECGRRHETMLDHSSAFVADAVYSVMELENIDPDRCFLEQGVVCMGPMTREGCTARCTAANVPCRGCMGPSRPEFEQGGKMVDALAAVLPAGAIMYLDDLIGTGYRFSTAVSVLPGLWGEGGEEQ